MYFFIVPYTKQIELLASDGHVPKFHPDFLAFPCIHSPTIYMYASDYLNTNVFQCLLCVVYMNEERFQKTSTKRKCDD